MKFKIPKYKYQTKRQRGFTILESLVAIVVLSISISGAFSAVQQGLSQSIVAKDEIKAFYLAQEAIEVIRNRRDVNQLYKIDNPTTLNTWLYGIAENSGDDCYFGNTCLVDATSVSDPFKPFSDSWLRQDATTFLYSYDGGDPATNFKREVQIESINVDEVSVTVRIVWKNGLITREFKVKALLFNWI